MTQEIPVIWIQCATCTGCSVSVLNVLFPTIKNVLIDEVIPGKHINLKFQATVMAGAGEQVIKVLEDTQKEKKGGYVLIVEGSIPTKDDGIYGEIGHIPIMRRVADLGKDALATIALGTCSAYGGIPAGKPNPTGCVGVRDVFEKNNIETPLINIPGCPPHPDWFVGTVAEVLLLGLDKVEVDEHLRPKTFYGKLIHENCPRRAYFDEGKFAKKLSDGECLYELGCKGPVTYADCFIRRWNSGVNWCIDNNHPCIGCCEPDFPDVMSPFFEKLKDINIPTIGEYWKIKGR